MSVARREYKVEVISEGGLSTLLVGSANLPVRRTEEALNRWAEEGWALNFMVLEHRRFLLFWKREAVVITLVRQVAG